mmetsp:Transcript_111111/g.299662  ORF Transcript_111111/g.299662 Transcript_111111/m.299662 type:complete len:289 (-) Transcript_111111:627-1493(-)
MTSTCAAARHGCCRPCKASALGPWLPWVGRWATGAYLHSSSGSGLAATLCGPRCWPRVCSHTLGPMPGIGPCLLSPTTWTPSSTRYCSRCWASLPRTSSSPRPVPPGRTSASPSGTWIGAITDPRWPRRWRAATWCRSWRAPRRGSGRRPLLTSPPFSSRSCSPSFLALSGRRLRQRRSRRTLRFCSVWALLPRSAPLPRQGERRAFWQRTRRGLLVCSGASSPRRRGRRRQSRGRVYRPGGCRIVRRWPTSCLRPHPASRPCSRMLSAPAAVQPPIPLHWWGSSSWP